jgi:translation initiation factor IF-3
VPVPRRFDRQPPERDQTRINERIRVPEVRLIDESGQQVGIIPTREALRIAQERDLDLVEVAPDAKPPVCRILDYSKYKYEQIQKQKAARKHQQQINVREIKFRPKIAQHDYDTKKGHVMRFLKARDKVKVTIMFRGREMAHPERGEMILNRLAEELGELAVVEQRPQQDGRNMTMMLAPSRQAAETTGAADDGGEASPGRNGGGRSSGSGSRRDRAAAEKAAEAAAAAEPVAAEPDAAEPAEAEPAAAEAAEPAEAEAAEPAEAEVAEPAEAEVAEPAEAEAAEPAEAEAADDGGDGRSAAAG